MTSQLGTDTNSSTLKRSMISLVEEWRSVYGYTGLYEVSSLGRVRSLPRNQTRGKILKLQESFGSGSRRLHVGLSKNGAVKIVKIHHLVLDNFVRRRRRGEECLHTPDSDTSNNSLSNLKWGTSKENSVECAEQGRGRNQYGSFERRVV